MSDEKTASSVAYAISDLLMGPDEMLSIDDSNPLIAIMIYAQHGKVFEIAVRDVVSEAERQQKREEIKPDSKSSFEMADGKTASYIAYDLSEILTGEMLGIDDSNPLVAIMISVQYGKVFEITIRDVVSESEREEKLLKLQTKQIKSEPFLGEEEFRDLPESDLLDIFKGAVLKGQEVTLQIKECLSVDNSDQTELANLMGDARIHNEMMAAAKVILCERGQTSGFKAFATGKYPAALRLQAAYAVCRDYAEVAKQTLQELVESNEDGLREQARWGLRNLLQVTE